MKTVTYCGPDDPRDRTTRFRIDEHLLPKGVAVEVSDDVAAELEAIEGQSFEIGESGPRQVSPKARALAEAENVDLDSIEGDGPIGVDDVRAAIDQAETAATEED